MILAILAIFQSVKHLTPQSHEQIKVGEKPLKSLNLIIQSYGRFGY